MKTSRTSSMSWHHVNTTSVPQTMKVDANKILYTGYAGAAGTANATSFADDNILAEQKVTSVHVRHGKLVDSLQVIFKDNANHVVESPQHGGDGGGLDVFDIDADAGEYLVAIDGHAGKTVDSIGFTTNTGRKSAGGQLWGGGGGGPYHFEVPDGYEIVGFTGKNGPNEDENNRNTIGSIGIAYRQRIAG